MLLINLAVSDLKQVIKRSHEFHDRFAVCFADRLLNHFVSNSLWGEEPIIDAIERTVSVRIGDAERGGIHIDESDFPKQSNNGSALIPYPLIALKLSISRN